MPFIDVDLPTQPPRSLRIKQMTDEEVKTHVLAGNVRLFSGRRRAWKELTMSSKERTFSGVKVRLHVDDTDPDRDVKMAAISVGIERVIKVAGLTFPDATVEIYTHGANQACLGYLLPLNPTNKFVIILGQGVLRTRSQLVSTQLKEANARMGQDRAEEVAATAAVVHELGHCFHQLRAPSQYYLVSQAMFLRGKAQSELASDYVERHQMLNSASIEQMDGFCKAVNAFGAQVSTYAATHPNEFIAECFAGQVMGLPYPADVLQAYAALGGPPVPGVVSTRKGRPRAGAFSAPAPIALEGDGL